MGAKEKFMERIEIQSNGCWNWTGHLDKGGYGHFGYEYKSYLAHRFIYKLMAGKLTPDLVVAHLCNNRACVNPFHLKEMAQADNLPVFNYCINGHEFTEENTYTPPSGYGRHCKECRRQASNLWKELRRNSDV